MPDLSALMRQKNEKLEKMRAIITKTQDENRSMTDGEIQEFNGLDEEVKRMNETMDKEIRLMQLQNDNFQIRNIPYDNNNGENRTGDQPGAPGEQRDAGSGFANIGEFFACIATNRTDERLRPFQVQQARAEGRSAQSMNTGTLGGFVIPSQFMPGIMSVTPQQPIIRPGATVIPAGDPPDAELPIPALDQGSAQNMYGGVLIYHSGESISITESTMKVRQVKLKPKSLKGFIFVPNELMNNWAAVSVFLQTQLRLATMGAEDYDCYRGTGANSAMGILNAVCRVNYTRATAAQIAYADIVGMFARAKLGGSLVWIASQTTIPQLANVRDTGNNNLWIQNARDGLPSSMMGYPVLWNERAPALGSAGDLALVDRQYYLIKDGSGPRVDISTEFRFQHDETCFRIVWNVDGAPWLNEPIPLEGSTSNTISPFVVLN